MIRKARITDVKQIQALINVFAGKDLMLSRPLSELYENIRDFWVIVEGKKIAGCCALHIFWQDLAEVKCLAVAANMQGRGLGKQLVTAALAEAKLLGAKKIFVLTYKPAFFKKFGFKRIRNSALPHMIWAECIKCCKFPGCNEIALLKIL